VTVDSFDVIDHSNCRGKCFRVNLSTVVGGGLLILFVHDLRVNFIDFEFILLK